MPLPAAAKLIEFTRAPVADKAKLTAVRPALHTGAAPVEDPEPVALAFLRGRYQGLDDGRVEFEARLKAAEAAFEERLAAERAKWVAEQGAVLGERIAQAFTTLGDELGDSVGAILTPFLDEKLRQKVVEELLRALEKVLKGGRPSVLKMSGPHDLLETIRQALGASSAAIEFETTTDVDVRVVADKTVIETQLEAWLQKISGRAG